MYQMLYSPLGLGFDETCLVIQGEHVFLQTKGYLRAMGLPVLEYLPITVYNLINSLSGPCNSRGLSGRRDAKIGGLERQA